MRRFTRWRGILALLALSLVYVSDATPEDSFRPQDFVTKSSFRLVVRSSKVLRAGQSAVMAKSAFATRLHGLMPGKSEGLEILFFSQPITDASRVDLLENHARQLKRHDYAAFVLYLDKQNKIWQVNLSYVIPGTTVARTVAWKPVDLGQFSAYRIDGKRVTLKSKGLYQDADPDGELSVSWDVDVNLPVFDQAKP